MGLYIINRAEIKEKYICTNTETKYLKKMHQFSSTFQPVFYVCTIITFVLAIVGFLLWMSINFFRFQN